MEKLSIAMEVIGDSLAREIKAAIAEQLAANIDAELLALISDDDEKVGDHKAEQGG